MNRDDQKTLEYFLAGNEETYEALLRKYLKPVFNFLFRLTGGRESAEDLAQETFLKAWKNRDHFDSSKNFRTWLFTIARNSAFDWLKKKKEIPFASFTSEEGENWLENISDGGFLPDEILERKDITKEFEKKLGELPELYREILLLHYKEDFSLHEIAEILGEPYNTVKSRHQRALLKLKQRILGE
jgi:RNA polymerase sigma-70 factor, ECF subfamily